MTEETIRVCAVCLMREDGNCHHLISGQPLRQGRKHQVGKEPAIVEMTKRELTERSQGNRRGLEMKYLTRDEIAKRRV